MLYATSGKHISVLQEFLKNMQCKRKKKKKPTYKCISSCYDSPCHLSLVPIMSPG